MCLKHGRGLFARVLSLRKTLPPILCGRPAKHDSMSRREFFLLASMDTLHNSWVTPACQKWHAFDEYRWYLPTSSKCACIGITGFYLCDISFGVGRKTLVYGGLAACPKSFCGSLRSQLLSSLSAVNSYLALQPRVVATQ